MNDANDTQPTKSNRIRRWTVRVIALVVLFGIGWWGMVRITATTRAVQYFVSPQNGPITPEFSSRSTLRVMTWNIAHGRGLSESNFNGESFEERDRRLTAIAAVIREQNADVVILNEVDFNSSWSSRINQAAIIAERAGYVYRVEQRNYDTSLPFFSLKFGNVILSRAPMSNATLLEFPTISRWKAIAAGSKRGLVVTIESQDDIENPIQVIAVHLESPWGAHVVRSNSTQVIRNVVASSEMPTVVAGDFNTSPPGYPGVRAKNVERTAMSDLLDDDLMSLHSNEQPTPDTMTYRADSPDRAIDWVLFTKDLKLKSHHVLQTDLSDHRPVVVELQMDE